MIEFRSAGNPPSTPQPPVASENSVRATTHLRTQRVLKPVARRHIVMPLGCSAPGRPPGAPAPAAPARPAAQPFRWSPRDVRCEDLSAAMIPAITPSKVRLIPRARTRAISRPAAADAPRPVRACPSQRDSAVPPAAHRTRAAVHLPKHTSMSRVSFPAGVPPARHPARSPAGPSPAHHAESLAAAAIPNAVRPAPARHQVAPVNSNATSVNRCRSSGVRAIVGHEAASSRPHRHPSCRGTAQRAQRRHGPASMPDI